MLVSVGLFGVGTIVLGLTTSFAVAWIALAVLSGAGAVSVFIRGTLVPLVTPADKRDVLAVEMVFIGASNELGAFESGVVGRLLGPALLRGRARRCGDGRDRTAVGRAVPGAPGDRPLPPSPSTERTCARR